MHELWKKQVLKANEIGLLWVPGWKYFSKTVLPQLNAGQNGQEEEQLYISPPLLPCSQQSLT